MKARSATKGWEIAAGERGRVVLVTPVGGASGARAAAASLACAASEPDRAALLIDLAEGRPPRPTLIATAGARTLEERLAAHLPDAQVASRGQVCQLSLPPDRKETEQIAAALPLVRESAAVIHLPPSLLRAVLDEPRISATGVLLRADLAEARALTALAVHDLITRDLRVVVQKHSLPWLVDRLASFGAFPSSSASLPSRTVDRLLATRGPSEFQDACYRRQQDATNQR